MDLFFDDSVQKKSYTIEEALKHIFSSYSLYSTLNLSVRGKVVCKVLCDTRAAATFKFETLSGPFAVAEALYSPARAQLKDSGCFYEGPPEPLPGSFELPEESRRKIVVTFGPAPTHSDSDDDNFEFL